MTSISDFVIVTIDGDEIVHDEIEFNAGFDFEGRSTKYDDVIEIDDEEAFWKARDRKQFYDPVLEAKLAWLTEVRK